MAKSHPMLRACLAGQAARTNHTLSGNVGRCLRKQVASGLTAADDKRGHARKELSIGVPLQDVVKPRITLLWCELATLLRLLGSPA